MFTELSDIKKKINNVISKSLTSVITVNEYVNFLNLINHKESKDNPIFVNIINKMTQIYYHDKKWYPKTGVKDEPIVLLTFDGAKSFSDYYELSFINVNTWNCLMRDIIDNFNFFTSEINIEEKYQGLLQVKKSNSSNFIIGNCSYWGESINDKYAYKLGLGWNKLLDGISKSFVDHSWKLKTSVSNGLRFMKKDDII